MLPRSKKYNPFVQIAAMQSRFPQFKVKRRGHLDIEFIGDILVKTGFPIYTVSIHYLGDTEPSVRILKPTLVDDTPHFYKNSNRLCLFKPNDYKWNRRKLIATDIVPWAAGWIYFYEIWLKTKVWYGPEADHSESNKD